MRTTAKTEGARDASSASAARVTKRTADRSTCVNSQPARIVLADDDARTAACLASLLREDGYDVEVLSDSGEAGNDTPHRARSADALVASVARPGSRMIALLRRARAANAELAVFVLSAYPDVVASVRLEGRPPEVITKPVGYHALRDALGAALGARTAARP